MVITLLLLPSPHPKLIRGSSGSSVSLDKQESESTCLIYIYIFFFFLLKHSITIETYLLQSTKCFGRSTIGISFKHNKHFSINLKKKEQLRFH